VIDYASGQGSIRGYSVEGSEMVQFPCKRVPVYGHRSADTASRCPACGGGSSGRGAGRSRAGSGLSVRSRSKSGKASGSIEFTSNKTISRQKSDGSTSASSGSDCRTTPLSDSSVLPKASAAVATVPEELAPGVQKAAEYLTRYGLSDDKANEFVGILHDAAWDVIKNSNETSRKSHVFCALFNRAAKFIEKNSPKNLAEEAIKSTVERALREVGGIVAADPCKSVVVTAVKEFMSALTDTLGIRVIGKIVLALRLLAVVVCPNSCPDSDEAGNAIGKAVTEESLKDA